ncbi:dehydrogenase/reductase SDR family member 13-like [Eucyclogobius newberryi]|uniref:dehydrogenase/reductase SDR family member 13-like n=1 Tax=Eucyclogobius newberryi TaxID=166745 RepID=UPI003B5A7538
MLQFVLLASVVAGVYVTLNKTLFKRSRCHGNLPMAKKTVVITGGNSGIGKATALSLARRGARVIIGCRNQCTAEAAILEIQKETGNSDVVFRHLDLASLTSVRGFAENLLKTEPNIDILINNAGLVGDGRTEEGFGLQFGVNHLGHFFLTSLLLPKLKQSPSARVVTVSSMAHRWGSIDFQTLLQTRDLGTGSFSWQFFKAYCSSKLCNILFTRELSRRLQGSSVSCFSVHPGVIRTDLARNISLWQKVFVEPVSRVFFLSPEEGAQTTLHCVLQEGLERLSGAYFCCCSPEEPSVAAKDPQSARRLWEESEKFCGLN